MEESLLKEFAQAKDKDKVQDFYEKALSILTTALDEMREISGITSLDYDDTRIFPMGDYTNDTFIDQTGELEIVIATSNPQIKVANSTFIKNLREAKSKKEKAAIINKGTFDEIVFNYASLLSQYFEENSVVLVVNQGIKVLCLEEYGFKLLIRFATYSEDDQEAILNFWDPLSKNSRKINLFLYNENMTKKDEETAGNYKKLVRIFKNIRKTILMNKWAASSDLNKYFVELITYNIPSSIMQDEDISLVFKKAVNYLDNCNVLTFKSFDNENSIETFELAKVSYSKTKNFISYMSKIAY